MAKTAKLKQKHGANPRSRAAKRAASPSNTDNTLKEVPRASDATPLLAARRNGGISKSKKKQKPLKRGQRVRQERGLARAEAIMDQMAKKVEGAQSREAKRRRRRAVWDQVNDLAKDEERNGSKFLMQADEVSGQDGDEWDDEDDENDGDAEMKVMDGVADPATTAGSKLVVADRTASANTSDNDDLNGIT